MDLSSRNCGSVAGELRAVAGKAGLLLVVQKQEEKGWTLSQSGLVLLLRPTPEAPACRLRRAATKRGGPRVALGVQCLSHTQ